MSDILVVLFASGLTLGCLVHYLVVALDFNTMRTLRNLRDLDPEEPDSFPKVSIIIAARDEADTIEAAMASKLAQNYPDLEFILVDDRSTDATGEIMDRLAAEDPRVVSIHIEELPAGWLGKVHALHRGYEKATGEWILFSDADVWLAPDTMRKAVAWCEQEQLDHLPILPQLMPGTFWVDTVIIQFTCTFLAAQRVKKFEDRNSPVAVGSGSFNLFRRTTFDKTPGMEGIRMDVADDVSLGWLLKEYGAKTTLINGRDMVKVQYYASVPQLALAFERAGYAIFGRGRASVAVLKITPLLGISFSPLVAIAYFPLPWLQALGAITTIIAAINSIIVARWFGARLDAAIAGPFGSAIYYYTLYRGAWIGYRTGGMQWRDTFYPAKALREDQRYFFI